MIKIYQKKNYHFTRRFEPASFRVEIQDSNTELLYYTVEYDHLRNNTNDLARLYQLVCYTVLLETVGSHFPPFLLWWKEQVYGEMEEFLLHQAGRENNEVYQ